MILDQLLGLARLLPKRTVYGNRGPYLTRYALFALGRWLPRVYLNQFHRSDEDKELHNHPWRWAIAVVLKGGYIEQRENRWFIREPGSVVLLLDDVYHRVELLREESWSLFVVGPRTADGAWYFLDLKTREPVFWKEFIEQKGLTSIDDN